MAGFMGRGYMPRGYNQFRPVSYGQDTPNARNAYDNFSGGMVGSVMFDAPIGPARQQATTAATPPRLSSPPPASPASPSGAAGQDYFSQLSGLVGNQRTPGSLNPYRAGGQVPQFQGRGNYGGQLAQSFDMAESAYANPNMMYSPEARGFQFGGGQGSSGMMQQSPSRPRPMPRRMPYGTSGGGQNIPGTGGGLLPGPQTGGTYPLPQGYGQTGGTYPLPSGYGEDNVPGTGGVLRPPPRSYGEQSGQVNPRYSRQTRENYEQIMRNAPRPYMNPSFGQRQPSQMYGQQGGRFQPTSRFLNYGMM